MRTLPRASTTRVTALDATAVTRGLQPRLTVLVSYFYLKDHPAYLAFMLELAPYVDVLVDSGAFSDMMAGRNKAARGQAHTPITVADYAAWLREYGAAWWQYVALDVIYNPAATRANLAQLVAAGLRPMPVLTYPELPEAMRDAVQVNPHLCVAGGLEASADYMHQRIQRTFAATDGAARIHGLGYVQWPDLFTLPLYSVDASSWLGGARFGSVAVFDPARGLKQSTWRRSVADPQTRSAATLRALADMGVTRTMAADVQTWRRNSGLPGLATTRAHLDLHAFAAARQRSYFLVCSLPFMLPMLCGVLDGVDARGRFHYPTARARATALMALAKRERGSDGVSAARTCAAACIDVLKRRTTWAAPTQPGVWTWPPAARVPGPTRTPSPSRSHD